MCIRIQGDDWIEEGWGCCHCEDNVEGWHTYNGIQRDVCKCCGNFPCPDLELPKKLTVH